MTKKQTINRDNPPDIPAEVATCPVCGAKLYINDIDEWDAGGRVTALGFHIECANEPPVDWEDDYDAWYRQHWLQPDVGWLIARQKAYQWFDNHYRLDT